jgi:hypothetical protein
MNDSPAGKVRPRSTRELLTTRGRSPEKLCLRHLAARANHVPAFSALPGVLERSNVDFGVGIRGISVKIILAGAWPVR